MTAHPLLWMMRVSFWTVVVVVSSRKDPCPRASDGAHNTVMVNVGAYNTVWALTCLEGRKAPFWSGLMVLFYRDVGYGPRYCG